MTDTEAEAKVLEGQVALVTGGGRGLGRSIALALARAGAAVAVDDVFVGDDGRPAASTVAEEIRAWGGQALRLEESVASAAGVDRMVAETVREFGRVDILVNTAGNLVRGPLQELTESQWDSVIGVHLKGHFLASRAVLPHMLAQGNGRIIAVASRGAFFEIPENKSRPRPPQLPSSTAYSAAKAGIMGFAATLALETWDTGVTVNCLLPSATTQLFPGTGPRAIGGVPPSLSLDPDDVAPVVVYLCSPAAANISGRIIYAGGGDVIVFANPLDVRGSRLIRKHGRWTQQELAAIFPSLVGLPVGGA